jgi:Mrp family chromosome partitioning ATPase
VLVVLVEYFGTTVNSQRELADLTRRPVLGSVALGRGFRRSAEHPTIVEAKPASRAAAALRTIGTKVAYTGGDSGSPSVLVLGTAPGDGAADLALGLATVIARGGRRVALVDADDQGAALTELLGVAGRPGLTELLEDTERDPRDVAVPRPYGPSIVPYGSGPTYELLDPTRVARVIQRLSASHDNVIVTTAPIQSSGHALVWARTVAGVIVGVERERAKRDDVTYAMENLAMLGATILGTVLLGRAPRGGRRGAARRSSPAQARRGAPPPPAPPPSRPAAPRMPEPVTERRPSDKPTP